MHTSMRWRRTAAGLLGLLTAFTVLGAGCSGDTRVTVTTPEQTGISVSGTGRVTVVPDIGLLYLGVEISRPTVAAARDTAATAMDAVRASLKQNGIADKDVGTAGFSIQPQYDFNPEKQQPPQIIGYTVSNQLLVKVRVLTSLTKVLDDAVTAGGNDVRVNNVSFSVDEPEKFRDTAREQAVADGRAHAETLAKASGVTLGKVRSVSESQPPFPYPGPYPAAIVPPSTGFGGAGGESPASPGQQEITLTVSIVFNVE